MGRYPFVTVLERYLEKRAMVVVESTLDNESRILRHTAEVLEQLKEDGIISTTNPYKMGPADIKAYADYLTGKVEPETKRKYIQYLDGVLLFAKNPVIGRMKKEGFRLPKGSKKPIRAISNENLGKIQAAAGEIEGWKGARAKFFSFCYPATGVRPSELRLSHLEDLNTKTWKLWVRHPKGEGSWGEPRPALVLPQYRAQVLQYLKDREAYVRACGLTKATYLIPRCDGGRNTHYCSNTFRKIKKEVQELSGVEFRLKDFRPTFATATVDIDPNLLPDVSIALGHATIKTTQQFYAQIKNDDAAKRIEEAWERKLAEEKAPPTSQIYKPNLIEPEKYGAGYIW